MLSKVEKIVASENNSELDAGVVGNGTTLPADFVIMGVGVTPATGFLKGSGIELERDGGIRVDKYMRVKTGKDTKHVFAIGASDSRVRMK
jgi:apoptosis-inducing factor 3